MPLLTAFLTALTEACKAYAAWVKWQRHIEIEKIQDEILRLGIPGTPADKLRIDTLVERKNRKLEQVGAP